MPSSSTIIEFRIVLTVDDLDQALQLYRDSFGLSVLKQWESPEGRGFVLALGQATLELIDQAQADLIDRIEVGERVTGKVRLAVEVQDADEATTTLQKAGAHIVANPVKTPWGHLNVRLETTDGMQLTLFQVRPKAE